MRLIWLARNVSLSSLIVLCASLPKPHAQSKKTGDSPRRVGLFFRQGCGVVGFPRQNRYAHGSQTSALLKVTWRGYPCTHCWVPTHRVSVSLGRGQRICISNQFSGVVDAAGLGMTLWELLLYSLDFLICVGTRNTKMNVSNWDLEETISWEERST